jgi:hypothetical protein
MNDLNIFSSLPRPQFLLVDLQQVGGTLVQGFGDLVGGTP